MKWGLRHETRASGGVPENRLADVVTYRDIGLQHWLYSESGAFDEVGRKLADEHYSRRKPGSPQFMPPGQRFVLVSRGMDAVWGWWRPNMNGSHVAGNGLDGWMCSIFRRTHTAPQASDLVLDAERAISILGYDCGPDGLLTYVWDKKVESENKGYCYKVAGWIVHPEKPRSADNKKTLLWKPFELAGVRACGIMKTHFYSSSHSCARCGRHGQQIWVDASEDSSTYGLCQHCRNPDKTIHCSHCGKTPHEDGCPMKENTNMTMVPYEPPPDLSPETNEASRRLALLKGATIQQEEDVALFSEVLVDVKTRYKALEERKKLMTTPIRQAIKQVDDLFGPPMRYFAECEAVIKDKIKEWQRVREEQNRRALEEASVAYQQGDGEGIAQALSQVQSQQKVGGMSIQHRWTFKVVDPNQVPREYLVVNETAIRETMRAEVKAGRMPVVPGVQFFQEPVVSQRT